MPRFKIELEVECDDRQNLYDFFLDAFVTNPCIKVIDAEVGVQINNTPVNKAKLQVYKEEQRIATDLKHSLNIIQVA